MDLPAKRGKRKSESHDNSNGRLSKRLSLLTIEQNGSKLYVPVEKPSSANSAPLKADHVEPPQNGRSSRGGDDDPSTEDKDMMQVDESKHKVYIYNIDDELSSDSENEEGKLILLPDIEKHLRESRIPRSLLLRDDTESEGKELIVYSDPKSLSVPESKDGVRKAIAESRRRIREERRKAAEEAQSLDDSQTRCFTDHEMDID